METYIIIESLDFIKIKEPLNLMYLKDSDLIQFNGDIFDLQIENIYTNFGLRLGYFLWNMRGSNDVHHLSFYNKQVNKMSDDTFSLRGAYGTRLRQWIGADQLQEAININQDIDQPEDFKKPQGVDQLEKIYNDLKNNIPTCCQIFDPALDFEDSKFIPDLLSIMFDRKDKRLEMKIMYNTLDLNGFFINDCFFLKLLQECLASLLKIETGNIIFLVNKINFIENINTGYLLNTHTNLLKPKNLTSESLLKDIYTLSEMERHLRSCITKESMNLETVDIISIIEKLNEKFINKIEDKFWKEFGLALMSYILFKYGKKKYQQYIKDSLISQITCQFKQELEGLILCPAL